MLVLIRTMEPALQRVEHVELIGLRCEHAFEGGDLQDAVEPAGDLLFGLRIGLGEELIFEIRLRGRVELADVFGKRAGVDTGGAVLEQLAQRMDGGAGDRQHKPGDEGEGGVLPAGQFGRQRAEHIVEGLDG